MLNIAGEPGHFSSRRVSMNDPFDGGLINRRNGRGKELLRLAQILRCDRNLDLLHHGLDAVNDRLVTMMDFERLPLSL